MGKEDDSSAEPHWRDQEVVGHVLQRGGGEGAEGISCDEEGRQPEALQDVQPQVHRRLEAREPGQRGQGDPPGAEGLVLRRDGKTRSS